MSTIDIHQLNTQQLDALIAKAKANTEKVSEQPHNPRTIGEAYPVSASQQSVWLVSQDPQASAAYNITVNLLIKGPLDVAKLSRALDGVVERHASLRTGYRFEPSAGRAQQFLCEAKPNFLSTESFDNLAQWHKTFATKPSETLDIERGQVYRAHMAKLEDGSHILTLVLHHIAFDGWSLGILLRELKAFYLGDQQRLPVITKDYIEVALNEGHSDSKTALAYWQRKLTEAPVTRLPADVCAKTSNEKGFEGGVLKYGLGKTLAQNLAARGQALGMSNFMFFSGALQYLVGRYNDSHESVIGSYVSGREKMESQFLIGCFVNNIVLRQDWCESDTIAQYLEKTKSTGFDALANQGAPFPEVVKALGWQGDGHPIYQVGLVMQPETVSLDSWGDIELTALESDSAYAHMDLEVYVWPKDETFELVLNYDRSRYSEQRIQWLAEHYETILTALASAPLSSSLKEWDLVTSKEYDLLCALDARRVPQIDRLALLKKRLENGAKDDTALVVGERRYSSFALAQSVAFWMESFSQRSLKEGDRVAFWGERGLEQQAVLAACALYGVTYLPLDSTLPEVRCQKIIKDASPRLLVVAPERESLVSELVQVDLMSWEAGVQPTTDFQSCSQHIKPRQANDEFALLYTSGTTGKPKGVSLSVAAANARLSFADVSLRTLTNDRVLQRTPLGFVDALWEVLDTMIAGATSVVASVYDLADASRLTTLIAKEQVSKLYGVPSLLKMLSSNQALFSSVRHLYSTAEPFSNTLLLGVQRAFPNAQVFNLYGSTEVNDVMWQPLCADSITHGLLGQVVPGAAIKVVDTLGRQMPIGCPGEIVILGEQLLRHYTTEAQKDNLQSDGFRMGDIAKVLPNGQVTLLGRKDGMVKIRGNRVEVQEVQLTLREVTSDSGAVVYFDSDATSLVGCWTGDLTETHVRQQLLQRLPNYMVPSQLHLVELIPLLPHGKVDMDALKQRVKEAQRVAQAQMSNSITKQEQALADIYANALQVPACDIHKNVFDLGLSSIELNQVQYDINTLLGLAVDIVTLLQYPTIHELAQYLYGSVSPSTKPARRGQRTTRMRRRTK